MNVADGGISNDPVTIAPDEKETIVVTRNGEAYDYKVGKPLPRKELIGLSSRTLKWSAIRPQFVRISNSARFLMIPDEGYGQKRK